MKETGLIKECIRTPEQETPASVRPAARMENTMMVMEVLPIGRENAVSSQELAERLHFESVRDLQMEIARERKAGAVILSTCGHGGGYFPVSYTHLKPLLGFWKKESRRQSM